MKTTKFNFLEEGGLELYLKKFILITLFAFIWIYFVGGFSLIQTVPMVIVILIVLHFMFTNWYETSFRD